MSIFDNRIAPAQQADPAERRAQQQAKGGDSVTIAEKIEAAHARLQRAREIVDRGEIWPIHKDDDRRFVAKSHSGQRNGNDHLKLYLVDSRSCTCADYRKLAEENGGWCKHRLARELVLAEGSKAEGREQAPAQNPAPDTPSVAPQPASNKERYELAQARAEAERRRLQEGAV